MKIAVSRKELTDFVESVFLKLGVTQADAQTCAEAFVLQEMRGADTHGIRRLAANIIWLSKGMINARPERKVLRESGSTMVIDGDNGVGMPGCMEAMDRAIGKAREFGVGFGIVINSNHFLAAAPYCTRAAEAGVIGICASNTMGSMGYPGTHTRAISNSPVGFGIPTENEFSLVLDTALTTSMGKLGQWARKNATIPDELAGLNAEGKRSTDPKEVMTGTALPIGGHKGAGLAILVEVLTGVLGGGAFLSDLLAPEARQQKENAESQCCMAINIENFMPLAEFYQRMNVFMKDLKGRPLAPEASEILLPGERAARSIRECEENGIMVDKAVQEEVIECTQGLDLKYPEGWL
ncbi:MAG: Ldh family oxidoreductase [Chthoniobacterales bacterium]